jgi:uncharacterized membrane protein
MCLVSTMVSLRLFDLLQFEISVIKWPVLEYFSGTGSLLTFVKKQLKDHPD